MAGDSESIDSRKQREFLQGMESIISDIQQQGGSDELAQRTLQLYQDNIDLYQSFLDAQKSAVCMADDSETSQLKLEILQIRQQKLDKHKRNRDLSAEIISLRYKEAFRSFVEEFWNGIQENPELAERIFGIRLRPGDDPSKSPESTKRIDFVIENFLDIVKANKNFNNALNSYSIAAKNAQKIAEQEKKKAAELENKVSEKEQKLLEVKEAYDKSALNLHDSYTREEALAHQAINLQQQLDETLENLEKARANFDGAKSQFENTLQGLEEDLDSVNALKDKYQIVYDSVLELLPEEARADLPGLLKSDDTDLRKLVQDLFKEALVTSSELEDARQRYARAEEALEAIFGEEFEKYHTLGNVPREHYTWAIQTYHERAIKPLEQAKAEIESKKAELSTVQEGIRAIILLAKNSEKPDAESEEKSILSSMLVEELGENAAYIGDIQDGLNYLREKTSSLLSDKKAGEGKITQLQEKVKDLELAVEDLKVEYVPPPVNPQALVGQANTHRVLGKTYATKNNAQGAIAQYKMAAGLYQQAADASPDKGDEIKNKLLECKDALSKLEGVKHE